MARRRQRNDGCVRLYAGGIGPLRMIKMISNRQAARMVSDDKASAVYEGGVMEAGEEGAFIGVQLCESERTAKMRARQQYTLTVQDVLRSCVVLSRAEVEAIADRSVSRTEGLTDDQRDARLLRGLPEMDIAERARAKFSQMFGHMATA
jgi:hypothetical protein